MAGDPNVITRIYEQIPLDAMQQVSDSYMAWYVERVTRQLDETMANLRSELRENDQKEASFRPTPHELEAIERLQRSGVTGVDLLDRMVEQGDAWLAVTMSRLDHFERTGLAPKDYSAWCEHALSGAYDWIENDRLATGSGAPPSLSTGGMPAAPRPTPGARPDPAATSNPGGSPTVPGWLGNRNARNAAPSPSAGDATAPVPSVAPRADGAAAYSAPPGTPTGPAGLPSRPQSSPSSDDGPEDGHRNIFRIFTN